MKGYLIQMTNNQDVLTKYPAKQLIVKYELNFDHEKRVLQEILDKCDQDEKTIKDIHRIFGKD